MPDQFWTLTLAELSTMAEAKAKHQKARDEFALYCAWQTAALGRVKDFPADFQQWIHPKHPSKSDRQAMLEKIAKLPQRLP